MDKKRIAKFIDEAIKIREWSILQCEFDIKYNRTKEAREAWGENEADASIIRNEKSLSILKTELEFFKKQKDMH